LVLHLEAYYILRGICESTSTFVLMFYMYILLSAQKCCFCTKILKQNVQLQKVSSLPLPGDSMTSPNIDNHFACSQYWSYVFGSCYGKDF